MDHEGFTTQKAYVEEAHRNRELSSEVGGRGDGEEGVAALQRLIPGGEILVVTGANYISIITLNVWGKLNQILHLTEEVSTVDFVYQLWLHNPSLHYYANNCNIARNMLYMRIWCTMPT